MEKRRWFRYPVSVARWSIALALLYQSTGRPVDPPAPPEAATLPRAVPIDVRAEDDRAWAVWYTGALALRDDGLHVEMVQHLGWPGQGLMHGVIWFDAWGFGIAERSPAGFRVVAEQRIPAVNPTWQLVGDWFLSSPTHYFLDGIGQEDLIDRWPVFIHDVRLGSGPGGGLPQSPSDIREYVHLPRDTFDRLLSRRPWED